MPETIRIWIDGEEVAAPIGSSVAVAIVSRNGVCRRSVRGEKRGPLCGMGICYECRVEIDGIPNCRSCQILCEPGMRVRTGD